MMGKKQSYLIERGGAKYFHGREKQLKNFEDLLVETIHKETGSSFLIQGPPGVGKTALIQECCQVAKGKHWQVIELTTRSLHDPEDFFERITKDKSKKEMKAFLNINLSLIQFGMTSKKTGPSHVLNEKLIQSKPTLLYLDEAQTLINLLDGDKKNDVSDFLNIYHNLKSKHGFVFLFAGLSRTRETLESFGLSRFSSGCVCYLEGLDPKAERQVLEDWLLMEFQTPSDPKGWIDTIMQRTEGWPRHLQSYVNAMNEYLNIGDSLNDTLLQKVLDFGDYLKNQYYIQRCQGIPNDEKYFINKVIQSLPEHFNGKDFVSLLSKKVPEERAVFLYEKCLSKGIIHLNDRDVCSIPVPSLKTHLNTYHDTPNPSHEKTKGSPIDY